MEIVHQAGKGQLVTLEIIACIAKRVRGDGQDFCLPLLKLVIVLAQLRQVPTAEGSHEAAQEYQNDMLPAPKIGKAHLLTNDR